MITTRMPYGASSSAQAVAEALHRELGRVVPRAERLVELPADAADVDDPARSLLAHVGRHELDQPGQAEDVDLELAPRLVDRDVLDRAVRAVAGVVDQHVEPRPCSPRIRSMPAGHRGVVGDVHRERGDAGLRQRLHPVDPARHGVRREAGAPAAAARSAPRSRSNPRSPAPRDPSWGLFRYNKNTSIN